MMSLNKRGQLANNIWIIIILFIVLLTVIFGYWAFATLGPVTVGISQQLTAGVQNSVVTQAGANSGLANATTVATSTTNNFLGLAEIILYLAAFGMLMGFVGVCYYVRTFKWLAFVWVFLMIAAVFISFIFSNAYQSAASSSTDLAGFYHAWGTNDFIMNYLPYVVGVFGLISGIVLFVIASTGDEESTRNV